MAIDLDEFGIPKKVKPEADEFGIPIKKKTSSVSSTGSSKKLSFGSSPFLPSVPDAPQVLSPKKQEEYKDQQDIGRRLSYTPLNIPQKFGEVGNSMDRAKKIKDELPSFGDDSGLIVLADGSKIDDGLTQEGSFREDSFKNTTDGKPVKKTDNVIPPATGSSVATQRVAPLMAGLNSVSSSFYDIPKFIYDAFAIPQNLASDLLNIPELKADYDNISKGTYNPLGVIERIADYSTGESDKWAEKQQRFDDDITSSFMKGKFGDAGVQILDNITGSAPMIASIYLTGGVANATKLKSLGRTVANALPFASMKNQELEGNDAIPAWLKPINASMNGLSEILLEERFGTKAILDGITKKALEEGAEVAIATAKDVILGYVKKSLKKIQPVTDVISNGLEEAATTMAQNIVARATGEDKERKLFDGVSDALIVGSSQGLGATGLRGGYDYVINSDSKKKLAKLEAQRAKISADMDNPNLAPEVREALGDKVSDLNEEINDTLEENRTQKAKIIPEKIAEIEALETEIDLKNETLADPSISEESKAVIQDVIKTLQSELDMQIKEATKADPVPDSEAKITKEGKEAEANYIENDDRVTYDQKMTELDKRAQALPKVDPAPEIKAAEVVAEEQASVESDIDPLASTTLKGSDGKPITVFHGTKSEFADFAKTKSTRQILMGEVDVESDAFFFTPDKEFAKKFGDNIIEARLNITTPAQDNTDKLINAIKETYPDGSFETANGMVYMNDFDGDSWVNRIADKDGIDWFLLDDNNFIGNLKKQGVDGTGVWEDDGSVSYAVFDNKNIVTSKKEGQKPAGRPATQATETIQAPTEPVSVVEPEQDPEITSLEKEMNDKISSISKPDLKVTLVSAMDLVSTKDPIGNKKKHDQIKAKYKGILKALNCL